MRKLLFAALAISLLPSLALAKSLVGKAAPQFSTLDIDGKPVALESYKGRLVVLEWTNPGCPFVKKHYESGNMQRLQKQAQNDGIVWITINSSASGKEGNMTAEQAKAQIAADKAKQTAYILDSAGLIGKLYGAKTTPHMFVLDAEGTLVYAGAIDSTASTDPADIKDSVNYVSSALEAIKAGKTPHPAHTAAYGCSVKY